MYKHVKEESYEALLGVCNRTSCLSVLLGHVNKKKKRKKDREEKEKESRARLRFPMLQKDNVWSCIYITVPTTYPLTSPIASPLRKSSSSSTAYNSCLLPSLPAEGMLTSSVSKTTRTDRVSLVPRYLHTCPQLYSHHNLKKGAVKLTQNAVRRDRSHSSASVAPLGLNRQSSLVTRTHVEHYQNKSTLAHLFLSLFSLFCSQKQLTSLVPSLDDLTLANVKLERLATVVASVELAAIRREAATVVDRDSVACFC